MNHPLATITLLAASAVAQTSAGPFLACALHHTVGGMTIGPSGSVLQPGRLYLKRAGFVDTISAVPFPTPRPQFGIMPMFGPPAALPPGFRLNALSSGYHTIFFTYNTSGQPVLSVPMGSWGALVYSISRMSPGTGDPLVAIEAAKPEGAGGDVFSWILPGSDLPPGLAACMPTEQAQRAIDSTEMGLSFMPGMRPEVTDFDIFLPLYETEGSLPGLLDDDPWVYFALPAAVAADPAIASWFAMRGGLPVPPPGNIGSGATVLRMQWNSTAPVPGWSLPEVYVTWNELNLAMTDEIDALAVQENSDRVLLSLRGAPLGQQLMVTAKAGPAGGWIPARPYYYEDGSDAVVMIADKIGAAGGGDVDAVCEPDPTGQSVAAAAFASIVDCRDYLGFPVTLAAAATVTASASPANTTVAASVSGLTNNSGFGLYALGVGEALMGGGTALDFVPVFAGVVAGSNHTFDWTFPVLPLGAAYSLDVDFQWVLLDGPVLAFSYVPRGHF